LRLLTDTHALIWWWSGSDRLSVAAREAMADPANVVFVSSLCAWEIASKVRIGKLPEMVDHISRYGALIDAAGFTNLPLGHEQALLAARLPGDHRDPIDRLIAAQAIEDDLTVVTKDAEFAGFGCKVMW